MMRRTHSPLARETRTEDGIPPPHSEIELETVVQLLAELRPRAASIVIGSSRDAPSRDTADAIAQAWVQRGGHMLDVVDWPERAASWLRQARRFAAQDPDAWVVTGQVSGWVQMGRRLVHSTDWNPARTIGTASLATEDLIALGGVGTFDGLRGATRDGGTWEVVRTILLHRTDSAP
ncbi:type 1 periplasmic-binding domain-containing protein [Saccharopolyspora pogona]|uniref:hypothetical protein n=1 Tax=Saccharopolyspora pogona TaxID=333966 RepID=UPI0016866BF1|nr:hypothetical protein [Saccharopolyspora pogona]